MEPDLFRLKIVALGFIVLALFFLTLFAQRIFRWLKSRRLECFETCKLCPLRDGTIGLFALILSFAALSSLITFFQLQYTYQDLSADKVFQEFDIAAKEPYGMTILVYPSSDTAYSLSQPDQGMLLVKGESLQVEVEVIEFGSLLHFFGQPKLLKLLHVSGASTSKTSSQKDFTPLYLGQETPEDIWSFFLGRKSYRLHLQSPKNLKAGDTLELYSDQTGKPALRKNALKQHFKT